MKKTIKIILGKILHLCFCVFPINKKKILFISYGGSNYSDNPKYISIELLKKHPEIEQVWVFNNPDRFDLDKSIKKVKNRSLKFFFELTTSKCWVSSHNMPLYVNKRKRQLYINTWHGGMGFKKIGTDVNPKWRDMRNFLLPGGVYEIKRDSQMVDFYLSNSKFLSEIYRRSFWYKGDIIEAGYPRSDVLFDKQYQKQSKNKLYKYFDLNKDDKIILFAPTFRDNNMDFDYRFDYDMLYNSINEKTNQKYCIIIRLHPVMAKSTNKKFKLHDGIYDGSDYPDINDLLINSEYVITDYSSCMGDASLIGKKCLIYATDISKYERGSYFDMRKLPYPFADNMEELLKNILNFNYEKYKELLNDFLYKKLEMIETGNASKEIAKLIGEKMNEQ